MSERVNQGYRIIAAIPVGEAEFVLGVHERCPQQYVTWKCSDGTDYYWGHYYSDRLKATDDLCKRALAEVRCLEREEEQAREQKAQQREQGNQRQADSREER